MLLIHGKGIKDESLKDSKKVIVVGTKVSYALG